MWGSRTLHGLDQLADEWKYVPVRRTALYIEERLYRGTQWVVFEPNGDKETTTQSDINLGIVNIVAGFAPLKPAEFVVIKLQQMRGRARHGHLGYSGREEGWVGWEMRRDLEEKEML